ncbi:hypothetical protein PPERSA_10089 [Pseudocohnilembus persalinus]|uniref:Uncharacterized protein n=1 Tax=Pseudocohnilembus persalinus TaxID=266149 RepID=A0A0V0QK09_PSEPJ|nr:hypothetical protein PPERSA_10089 [Pseudocohnilembus persalinus]|eukprot:KRX02472.1 hypothetical protein PPERSA_10089 [Pseudocohnilembus persalinus]
MGNGCTKNNLKVQKQPHIYQEGIKSEEKQNDDNFLDKVQEIEYSGAKTTLNNNNYNNKNQQNKSPQRIRNARQSKVDYSGNSNNLLQNIDDDQSIGNVSPFRQPLQEQQQTLENSSQQQQIINNKSGENHKSRKQRSISNQSQIKFNLQTTQIQQDKSQPQMGYSVPYKRYNYQRSSNQIDKENQLTFKNNLNNLLTNQMDYDRYSPLNKDKNESSNNLNIFQKSQIKPFQNPDKLDYTGFNQLHKNIDSQDNSFMDLSTSVTNNLVQKNRKNVGRQRINTKQSNQNFNENIIEENENQDIQQKDQIKNIIQNDSSMIIEKLD